MAKIHIDPLEKKWIILIAGFLIMSWAVQVYYAAVDDINPPSNIEVIDSSRLHLEEGVGGGEFMEKNLGVKRDANGDLVVTMVAARYGFYPQHIEVPADTPVKFRMASFDVLHGVLIPFSNMNVMLVPGYVSEITTEFKKKGEFPLICNEYCGLGHAYMYGMINIVPKDQFKLTGVQ
jgi:cytochrome c oxidase subunit 2